MPLSTPAPRQHMHTRRIECHGYRRADGLWDVEAHIVDTKSHPFPTDARGELAPGEAVHDMWVRLTVDDDFVIREAEAATDAGPYTVCGEVAPDFARLTGLRIGPGWTREAFRRIGGKRGCTHLFELLRPVATTCFQTVFGHRLQGARGTKPAATTQSRPPFIDTCHALAADGPIVRRHWPDFYTGSE